MRISDWSSDVCSSDLQRRLLEDEGEILLAVVTAGGVTLPGDAELAGIGRQQPGDQPQHRALAAAGWSEQAQEVAVVNLESEAVQGHDTVRERLADARHTDHRPPVALPPQPHSPSLRSHQLGITPSR